MPDPRTLAHLSALYQGSDDPWQHRSSAYEQRKYAATLDMIGPARVAQGLEIGCGNGTLTARLLPLCDRLVAIDCVAEAAGLARAAAPGALVLCGQAPADLPDIRPDLVVLSEVLYYLRPDEIADLAAWLRDRMPPGGRVAIVSWTGETGETLRGPEAARLLAAGLAPRQAQHRGEAGFDLDLLTV